MARVTREQIKEWGGVESFHPKKYMGIVHWDSAAGLSKCVYQRMQPGGGGGMSDSWYFGSYLQSVEANQEACVSGRVPEPIWEEYLRVRDKLQPVMDDFIHLGVSTRRRRVYAEEGSELNLDRLAVHDPSCWERRKRGAKKQLIVLGIQYGYVAGAGEKVFVKNAAAAAAASDVLERLGYAVEIVGVSWGTLTYAQTKWDKWSMINTVTIKRSTEPLDPQNVLIIGLPAVSRVFEFGVWDAYAKSGWNMHCPPLTKEQEEMIGIDAFIGQKWHVNPGGNIGHTEKLQGFFNEMTNVL
jgi:hypothetical protein